VAWINAEKRTFEWNGPVLWNTPTVAVLDKIPLYTTPPAAQPATEKSSVAQTTPVQEPVAWMYQCSADNLGPVLMRHKQDWAKSGSGLWTEAPLYTSPQPAQRKPLTDEELRSIENEINPNMRWRSSDEEGITLYPSEYFELVRAIEAAHGIKENT
jgi:hypothetical protein